MKNKEKGFDTNPDMNRVTSDYDYIHIISFFQAEKNQIHQPYNEII